MQAREERKMEQREIISEKLNTIIKYSIFEQGGSTGEAHLIIYGTDKILTFDQQLKNISALAENFCSERLQGYETIMQRYFLSDAANQQQNIRCCGAASTIQQPPLNGCKVALWIYLQNNASNIIKTQNETIIERNGYRHIWNTSISDSAGNTFTQTENQLNAYKKRLSELNCTIANNCIRTWFFVNDIDNNYKQVVEARKAFFEQNGLTEHTHYIASTGIGGRQANAAISTTLDTYAIAGIDNQQTEYLHAGEHMNPTHEYGVTFERGTSVAYGDRKHIFVSGTASIDKHGAVMHVGNIRAQTHRMIENVEALISEANACPKDLAMIIVYLRDTADYEVVQSIFSKKYPSTPYIITLAPVCRPTWLIEMEAIAIAPNSQSLRNL